MKGFSFVHRFRKPIREKIEQVVKDIFGNRVKVEVDWYDKRSMKYDHLRKSADFGVHVNRTNYEPDEYSLNIAGFKIHSIHYSGPQSTLISFNVTDAWRV
ncbi:MAG: hypothetical protein MPK62_00370 [Alphaproteobacteria bacterium]|nr:hypothetical protein [Alphaproteobacteria bacterium]MDA8029592.1 hypothetical protein [Alphaproteobacteria bacterium]